MQAAEATINGRGLPYERQSYDHEGSGLEKLRRFSADRGVNGLEPVPENVLSTDQNTSHNSQAASIYRDSSQHLSIAAPAPSDMAGMLSSPKLCSQPQFSSPERVAHRFLPVQYRQEDVYICVSCLHGFVVDNTSFCRSSVSARVAEHIR